MIEQLCNLQTDAASVVSAVFTPPTIEPEPPDGSSHSYKTADAETYDGESDPGTTVYEQEPELDEPPVKLSDGEIFDRLFNSKNPDEFCRLWEGDERENERERSDNDLALCALIASHAREENQIDSVFRQSDRFREEWDEPSPLGGGTYGETIVKKSIGRLTSEEPSSSGETNFKDSTVDRHGETSEIHEAVGERKWEFTDLHLVRVRGRPKWAIEGILVEETVVILSGDSQSFKTFCTLGMAFCVATGRNWQGHRVVQGPVIYIAAEGGWTLRDRLEAWETHNQTKVSANFHLLEMPVAFGDETIVHEFTEFVREKFPVLIVIDTLSTCSQGLKENTTEDMATFVRRMKFLAQRTGATVVVLHHHNKSGGLRGAISLMNDADTHIMFRRKGTESELTTQITCVKHRGAHFQPFLLCGVQVNLATPDEHGKVVTSLVLEERECSHLSGENVEGEREDSKTTLAQKRLLEEAHSLCVENGSKGIKSADLWERLMQSETYSKPTFYRYLEKLTPTDGSGEFIKEGSLYVTTENAYTPDSLSQPMNALGSGGAAHIQ